ncbi:ATP-grasp domain-containing protein [Actinocatenispora thailandica]|uniref:ATP-grasp domain-containing protein n=1 Tax=Actinocatenispora thailandica TaxID=227318 RepID=A0A7R7DMG8_9ACTN|nr:hypothetical protein [Actinocatenispora thailandica]BCJ34271.1 ATP-grasp domain-containing protein [Actinocatenispora thailandica]
MRLDRDVPAVVLKLDRNVFHHGGLGVIRSLGRAGVEMYAVREDPLAPAARSRYLRGRLDWLPDPDQPQRVLAGLARVAERIGRRAVLIPTDDAGAILLAEHGSVLRRWFSFAAPPPALPRRLAGKASLAALGRELGLPAVESVETRDPAEARRFAERVGYPVVAKLTAPWRDTGGLRSTTVVPDPTALATVYATGVPVLLQEHVPGNDWFFHGYCDADSVCRPAFTGRKHRSYPPHAGLTSLGECVPNAALTAELTALLSRLGYRGIMDCDLRRDARDGRFRLLDFNPRIGAQFRLFTTTDGVDVARAAHLDLTGRPVPDGVPVAGRRFVVENYDTFAALGYLRRGELGLRAWLRSLRGVDEAAWFAADDLAPFGLMCLRTAWRAAHRPIGRRRLGGSALPSRPARSGRLTTPLRPARSAGPVPIDGAEGTA